MKIGILGSGMVGMSLAEGFLRFGHSVTIGSRTPGKMKDTVGRLRGDVKAGSFSDAASFGEMLVLAVKWDGGGALNALELAGKEHFKNKTLMDVTNPLIFDTPADPPALALGFPKSAGKTIQELLPDSKVVKAFNIVTAAYMTNPALEEGTPDMFIAGNSEEAKNLVSGFAEGWGWTVRDMGGIEQSYLLEALALIWIRYGFLNNHWTHAFKLLMK